MWILISSYRQSFSLLFICLSAEPASIPFTAFFLPSFFKNFFHYADKFAILTNGLGIVRHISFIDDADFKVAHPDLVVEKKTDSPDEDKSVGDASSLVPVLQDFFSLHPDFHPDTFLGDSAFDSADLYGKLFHDFHFSKALIPYNPRNESSLKKVGYNAYGYPTCPNDDSLAMKHCGITKEKGPADCHRRLCDKLSTIHSKPKTFNCLK